MDNTFSYSCGFIMSMRSFLTLLLVFCPLHVSFSATNMSRAVGEALLRMQNPEKQGDARQEFRTLCETVAESQREETEKVLLAALNDAKNKGAFPWIVRMLGQIGSEECVPTLAKMLQTTDGALWDEIVAALARIPDESAGYALRNALPQMKSSSEKIAILSALGFRAEPASIECIVREIAGIDQEIALEALQENRIPPHLRKAYEQTPEKILLEKKKKVNLAAIRALGKIGTEEAADELKAMRLSALPPTKMNYGPPLIECAGKILQQGSVTEALSLFQSLQLSEESSGTRCAAIHGMLQIATSPDDLQFLLFCLGRADQDPLLRDVCLGFLWNFDGKIGQLIGPSQTGEEKPSGKKYSEEEQIARFQKISPDIQASILKICGVKRDETAMPLIRYGMKSDDPALRAAAYGALAGAGGAETDSLTLLLQKLAEETVAAQPGPLEIAIVEGLKRTLIDGADEQIATAAETAATVRLKNSLLEIAGSRQLYSYLPLFLREMSDENASTREIAVQGYAAIAKFEDLTTIATAILQSPKGEGRTALERAAVRICERNPNKEERVVPILDLYAKTDEKNRETLLGLLGRLGGQHAFDVVLKAMREGAPTAKEAAFHALCNWPDVCAMDELYRLATKLVNKQLASDALRGYMRIVALPSQRSGAESIALFEKATPLADTPELQNELLRRVATVRSVEALDFVLPYLEKPENRDAAYRAVLELARDDAFHAAHRMKFNPLLETILRNADTGDLSEQARRLLDRR